MPTLERPNDVTLYYDDEGSGAAILFLHGCWCSSAFFDLQAKGLKDRFRVIRLDFRGHGRSAAVDEGLTVETYADDVRALIDELGVDPVVVGWSMGALVIWEYHRLFGSAGVRGAVIVDQSASDFRWPDWPLAFAGLEELRDLMVRTQVDRPALVEELCAAMFAQPLSPELAAWVKREMLLPSAATAGAILFDQTVRDYRSDLASFTPKTLVCFGRDEKIMPTELGRHLAAHIPLARLEIFERSGHCPFMEEPDRFNSLVASFASSLT